MHYPYEHGDEIARRLFSPKDKYMSRYRRRRNPMRGDCPNCGAGLRQKHYDKNQCWRCKGQLSAGRSSYTFGRALGGDFGIAARRRGLRRRRRNPGYFHHDAGVFGGPSFGRRRLRRYNPAWLNRAGGAIKRGATRAGRATKKWYDEKGRDQMISMGRRAGRFAGRTAGRAASAAGRGLQRFGDRAAASMAEPARYRRLRRYRRNPDFEYPCQRCFKRPCTCPGGPICSNCYDDPCKCGHPDFCQECHDAPCRCCAICADQRNAGDGPCVCDTDVASLALGLQDSLNKLGLRRNPNSCPDCDGRMCDCGSHSSYHPNPKTTRIWDPISAPTGRWKPGQDWAEVDPIDDEEDYETNPMTGRWDPYRAPTARWKPGQDWAEAEPQDADIEEPTASARYRRYRRNG